METIKGTIERITYCNQQNGYTVAELTTSNGDITIVGTMPFISEGEFVEINFTGEIKPVVINAKNDKSALQLILPVRVY